MVDVTCEFGHRLRGGVCPVCPRPDYGWADCTRCGARWEVAYEGHPLNGCVNAPKR